MKFRSIRNAAEELGISYNTLRAWCNRGSVPFDQHPTTGAKTIQLEDVIDYLKQNPQAQANMSILGKLFTQEELSQLDSILRKRENVMGMLGIRSRTFQNYMNREEIHVDEEVSQRDFIQKLINIKFPVKSKVFFIIEDEINRQLARNITIKNEEESK